MQEAHGLLSESTKPEQGFSGARKLGGGRFQKRFHGRDDTGSAVWRVAGSSTDGGEKTGEEGAPHRRTSQDLAEQCNCRRTHHVRPTPRYSESVDLKWSFQKLHCNEGPRRPM